MAGEAGTETIDLRVADAEVGQLRYRPRGEQPPGALLRLVGNLIGLELERSRAPERASEAAVGDFIQDLLARRVTDRENIVARGGRAGLRPGRRRHRRRGPRPAAGSRGGRLARPRADARRARRPGDRARRPRRAGRGELVAPRRERTQRRRGPAGRARAGDPGAGRRPATGARAADGRAERARVEPAGLRGDGRPQPPHERAGRRAPRRRRGAARRERRGGARHAELSFEETGAYRLLLPAMAEDPRELQGFYDETVAKLAAYDEQYETELVRTLETFLDADGNVAKTSEKLFTHRHTIRYRLERVKELTDLDVSSTDGRERLSLGLKAMRVLGIVPPRRPRPRKGQRSRPRAEPTQGPLGRPRQVRRGCDRAAGRRCTRCSCRSARRPAAPIARREPRQRLGRALVIEQPPRIRTVGSRWRGRSVRAGGVPSDGRSRSIQAPRERPGRDAIGGSPTFASARNDHYRARRAALPRARRRRDPP